MQMLIVEIYELCHSLLLRVHYCYINFLYDSLLAQIFVGPDRAKECPREAIQEDVPNEWCKFFSGPSFDY